MNRYTSLTWNDLLKSRPDLPDYDDEVVLTVRRKNSDIRQITTGIRYKTDADGEHWEFKLKNGSPNNWEVVAWGELEPYEPDD